MNTTSMTAFPAVTLRVSVGVILASVASGQEVLHRFEGSEVLDVFGRADEVGDLDGDGVPDIAHLEDQDHVVFRSGADGSVIAATLPDLAYRGSKTTVKGIGDFDGDGSPDIMVGVPGFDVYNSFGRVDIISGATAQVVVAFAGNQAYNNLGWRIDAVGDVDGDGYTDVLYAGRLGSADLRYGPDGSRTRTHPEYANEGAIAGLGDVDGDGYPDYGVGSPNFIVSGLDNAGAFYVFSGLDGTLLRRIVGDVYRGFLGRAAAPAGDVNDDGYGDMLIAISSGDRARVYSGFDGSILWEYSPPGVLYEAFGVGMAGGNDLTGDGRCDWVVGAQLARDSTGVRTGAFYMFDGASGALIWKLYGLGDGPGQMGADVFLADDMNGDGLAEIGYGDVTADINGISNVGVLTIIAGAPGSASTYCTTNVNSIGRRAKIAREGPVSVGNNEFALQVTDAVPGSFGLFYYGTGSVNVPFGDGIRCVGGMTQRLFPPIAVDATGNANRILDFTQPPVAPGGTSPIDAGATRYFQFWYRDTTGPGGTGFNLSDAMEILFTP
jgi:hypothetical protein